MTKSKKAAAPFDNKDRPWYKRATTALLAPQGGIPTAGAIYRRVDCGPFILDFIEPRAAFGEDIGSPDAGQISLNPDAFEVTDLGMARADHPTIELGASNWIYRLPRLHSSRIFPVQHPPYAVITAHWRLERVKHGIKLNLDSMNMLEDYLRHDYISHLESEGGFNWNTRREVCARKTLSGATLSQARIDDMLRYRLLEPPSNYEVMTSNGLYWLRYLWEPRGVRDTLAYTTTLLPDVLLTASFHIGRMNSEPWEDWWSLFLEDCEILVKTIVCRHKALPNTDEPTDP